MRTKEEITRDFWQGKAAVWLSGDCTTRAIVHLGINDVGPIEALPAPTAFHAGWQRYGELIRAEAATALIERLSKVKMTSKDMWKHVRVGPWIIAPSDRTS